MFRNDSCMSKSLKSDRYVIKDIDDDVSISSEEDERGVQLSDSNFYCNTSCQITVDGDHELWDFCEIESGLRELPNANVICDMFNNEDKLNAEFMSNNTDDVNTILLFAVWYKKPKTVYRLLNEFKADANAADSYGRTALHLACFVGDPLSTEYLIYNAADPQNWDRQLAMTPLHCAAASGNLECLEQLLVAGVDVNIGFDRYTSLYYAVHRNNKDCVEALLKNGANPNCTQPSVFSPLHVAVSVGYIGCVRTLLKYKANIEASYGERKIRALHIAASENYIECLELLLEAGADTEARTINDQTALHLACLSQNHDAVQTLIDYGADVHARYKDGRTSLHASLVRNCGSWGCTAALLKAKCDVNLSDDFGYTPLHIAALNEFSDCAIMLIEYGADLTAKTNGGVTAMSFVSRRTPEVLQDFRRKLDVSINAYSQHEIGDIDCEIKLDFRLLVPNKERGETELLKTFIENGHRKILKHPLCETFLYLKWSRIRKFFLFSLIFYAVFGVVFTTYVLGVYQKCDNTTVIESANGSGIDECISKKQLFFPLLYIALVLNFCVLVGEIYQMANGLGNYVRYWGNWLQCATIIGVFLSAIHDHDYVTGEISHNNDWQHHVAGLTIFLVWLDLMMYVGKLPIFDLYIQMFTTVSVNFLKFIVAYSCLLIAFGLSFVVLYGDQDAFNNVPKALLKTIVMMVGEIEYEDISQSLSAPITSQIMLFAFIILMTVTLANLMVGLAVSDIQALQASAGLNRLMRQTEIISSVEELVLSKFLERLPLFKILEDVSLLRTARHRLQFKIKPNDPREDRIPSNLIKSIFKCVVETKERNLNIKRCRQKSLQSFKETTKNEPNQKMRRPKLKDMRAHSLDLDRLEFTPKKEPKERAGGSFLQKQKKLISQETLDIIDEEKSLFSFENSSTEEKDDIYLNRTKLKNLLNLIETNLNSLNELKDELKSKKFD